eukprot:5459979-Ditylum_brightwellii.AAC.1
MAIVALLNLLNLAKLAIIPDEGEDKVDLLGRHGDPQHKKGEFDELLTVMNNADVYGRTPDLQFGPNNKKSVRDTLLNHDSE